MKRFAVPMFAAFLISGCSSKGGGGGDAVSCPAFELKVDGQPVTGFTNKLAFTHKKKDERIHQVSWFNHDKATCADVTSMKGRTVPDGEVNIAAMSGGAGAFGQGVMMSSYSQLGVAVEVVGAAPQKEGDKVTLCVPETSFKPTVGEHQGKTVTVKGLMEGSWCGFMDWDAK